MGPREPIRHVLIAAKDLRAATGNMHYPQLGDATKVVAHISLERLLAAGVPAELTEDGNGVRVTRGTLGLRRLFDDEFQRVVMYLMYSWDPQGSLLDFSVIEGL